MDLLFHYAMLIFNISFNEKYFLSFKIVKKEKVLVIL